MADLRILSYLPNPRLYEATIAARFSGAELEVVGGHPRELPDWTRDYDARPLTEDDKARFPQWARQAVTGFSGVLYKSGEFLRANLFGDVPAAFGAGGKLGLFESNSIMRAAARLGPDAAAIFGSEPLLQSRIDGFLDRSLVFARDLQRYLLAAREENLADIHQEMQTSTASYLRGIEQALSQSRYIACDHLTLADIVYACEMCQLCIERSMTEALAGAGLQPLMGELKAHERAHAYLRELSQDARFSQDLSRDFQELFEAA